MSGEEAEWPSIRDVGAEAYRLEWVGWARSAAPGLGVDPQLEPAALFDAIRVACDRLADEHALGTPWSAVWLAVSGCAGTLHDQFVGDGPAA